MSKRQAPARPPVITDRLARCRRQMRTHRIRAYLITNPADYRYMTGFTGEDSALLITGRGVHLISDRRFEETIRRQCPWVTTWMRLGSLTAEIAKVCQHLAVRSLAIDPDHMTVSSRADIKKRSRLRHLRSAPPMMASLRRVKGPTELTAIRKSLRIAEEAFRATRASIRIGQTELELAARLEYEMKIRGASQPAFPTICAEGANAAHPHAHPGRRRVKRGSAILLDWGARAGGYCSDLTRMLFIGSMPRRLGEVYGIVLKAQQRAISGLVPGARMCDVDTLARDVIDSHGYGGAFNHGLGHGLGLDVHEPPSLSWRSKEKLKAGMVVTVEPGIYLPGVGGVRIEDDVLVTPTGYRVLSRLGRNLQDTIVKL